LNLTDLIDRLTGGSMYGEIDLVVASLGIGSGATLLAFWIVTGSGSFYFLAPIAYGGFFLILMRFHARGQKELEARRSAELEAFLASKKERPT
jgi:hypothetical protein